MPHLALPLSSTCLLPPPLLLFLLPLPISSPSPSLCLLCSSSSFLLQLVIASSISSALPPPPQLVTVSSALLDRLRLLLSRSRRPLPCTASSAHIPPPSFNLPSYSSLLELTASSSLTILSPSLDLIALSLQPPPLLLFLFHPSFSSPPPPLLLLPYRSRRPLLINLPLPRTASSAPLSSFSSPSLSSSSSSCSSSSSSSSLLQLVASSSAPLPPPSHILSPSLNLVALSLALSPLLLFIFPP